MAEVIPKSSRVTALPGSNQAVGMWVIEAASASDTFKIPFLLTRSATADQSSVRVLSPATGVTVTAGALDANNEHTLTVASASAGQRVVLLSLHPVGRLVNGA